MKKEISCLAKYEVTPCTMAIIPQPEGVAKLLFSLVLEEEVEYKVSLSPSRIIEDACKFFGADLTGRLKWTKNVSGLRYKAPISIDPASGMYFFPTASPKNSNCCWIAHSHIKKINKISQRETEIVFKNGRNFIFDVSYGSMLNQVHRTAQLRYLLDRHLKPFNKPEKTDMIAERFSSFPLQ